MKQYVSPDRTKAISQVSVAINNPNRVWHTGANLLDLLDSLCTAKVFNGPLYGTKAEIYNEDGEMIAGYGSSFGWIDVPTADEMQFQSESMQIYYKAYKEVETELANGTQQTAAPAVSDGAATSLDVKA